MNPQLNNFLFRNINEKMVFTVQSENPRRPDHFYYDPNINRISTDDNTIVITNKGRRTDKILHIMDWNRVSEIAAVHKK